MKIQKGKQKRRLLQAHVREDTFRNIKIKAAQMAVSMGVALEMLLEEARDGRTTKQ